MKKYLLPLMVCAAMLVPSGISAEPRGKNNNNYHRGSSKVENSSSRPGGSNRPGGNSSNRPGGGKDHNTNHDRDHNKGNGKDHGKDHNKRPNGNGWGNSVTRPGGNSHRPTTPPPPPAHRPGYGWGGSVKAPGHRINHNPYYDLSYMIHRGVNGGRYDQVWMVGPGQYAVRYYRNGIYYMQYLWPETGRYGTPFRIVMSAPGEWYAYDNRNQWYYEDGNSLRISLNGTSLSPWTVIPSINLNFNF